MPGMPTRPLESYPMRVSEKLRYADTDRQGHVNNAVYATLCESGRTAFLFNPEDPACPPGTNFVIVRLAIEFRRELTWPGVVEVATGVQRIGTKSFTIAQGIFSGGTLVAAAENVMAIMDDATRRAVVLPAATRAKLEGWLLPVV